MGKRNPEDVFNSFLGDSSTDNTQATHKHSTDAVQTTHEQSKMKRYDVRMDPADWEALGKAAAAEGSSRGAIIRRLVREWLY